MTDKKQRAGPTEKTGGRKLSGSPVAGDKDDSIKNLDAKVGTFPTSTAASVQPSGAVRPTNDHAHVDSDGADPTRPTQIPNPPRKAFSSIPPCLLENISEIEPLPENPTLQEIHVHALSKFRRSFQLSKVEMVRSLYKIMAEMQEEIDEGKTKVQTLSKEKDQAILDKVNMSKEKAKAIAEVSATKVLLQEKETEYAGL